MDDHHHLRKEKKNEKEGSEIVTGHGHELTTEEEKKELLHTMKHISHLISDVSLFSNFMNLFSLIPISKNLILIYY